MHRQCSTPTADAKALTERDSDSAGFYFIKDLIIASMHIIDTGGLYRNSKNGQIPAYFCSLSKSINLLNIIEEAQDETRLQSPFHIIYCFRIHYQRFIAVWDNRCYTDRRARLRTTI